MRATPRRCDVGGVGLSVLLLQNGEGTQINSPNATRAPAQDGLAELQDHQRTTAFTRHGNALNAVDGDAKFAWAELEKVRADFDSRSGLSSHPKFPERTDGQAELCTNHTCHCIGYQARH